MSRIILAGLVAGLGMAVTMAIGEKVGLVRINLPRIDGRFFFKDRFSGNVIYFLGLIIHAVTSIGFAMGYLIFAWISPLTLDGRPPVCSGQSFCGWPLGSRYRQ